MTTLPDEIGELKELEWLNVRMETGDWTSVITSDYNLPDEIAEVKLQMLLETGLYILVAKSCQ